jgi:hypothetical protein
VLVPALLFAPEPSVVPRGPALACDKEVTGHAASVAGAHGERRLGVRWPRSGPGPVAQPVFKTGEAWQPHAG